jgi:acetyl esterase/lipase
MYSGAIKKRHDYPVGRYNPLHVSARNIDNTPTAIIYHAGGFVKWSKEMVPKPEIFSLAKMGFVVVVPNYRLCPQISVFDGPVTDAKDCLLWAGKTLPGLLQEKSVNVDPTRVVTMGHSAGGTLALLMVRLITEDKIINMRRFF